MAALRLSRSRAYVSPSFHWVSIRRRLKSSVHVRSSVPSALPLLSSTGLDQSLCRRCFSTSLLICLIADELYIVGDLNIRLDRQDDAHAKRLLELLEGYGLEVNKTGPTHKCGGQLDVVVTRTGQLGHGHAVSTLDNGLSDHKMLVWSTNADPVVVPVISVTSRPWRTVNIADFRAALTASPLCSHDKWVGRSADDLAQLYDTVD
jgi:hypothetical protein